MNSSGSQGEVSLLDARGVEKRFGGVVALQAVDFHINRNEFVGLIGPNGSGKTTLFDVLSGALSASSGDIRWNGQSVRHTSMHARARMGLVRTFQQSMLFPALTVLENLQAATVAARKQISASPALVPSEIMEYVQLSAVGNTRAAEVSWGQARLLGIGMALALQPTALLLDEPFAGLSPVALDEVTAILLRLRDDQYSVGIIDHELEYVLPICDRVVVLQDGKVIANGVPRDVVKMEVVQRAYLGDTVDAIDL